MVSFLWSQLQNSASDTCISEATRPGKVCSLLSTRLHVRGDHCCTAQCSCPKDREMRLWVLSFTWVFAVLQLLCPASRKRKQIKSLQGKTPQSQRDCESRWKTKTDGKHNKCLTFRAAAVFGPPVTQRLLFFTQSRFPCKD